MFSIEKKNRTKLIDFFKWKVSFGTFNLEAPNSKCVVNDEKVVDSKHNVNIFFFFIKNLFQM